MADEKILQPYFPPNEFDPNIHTDTSGTLPPGRLDVSDVYGQEPPLSDGDNVIAYTPNDGYWSAPRWVAAASLTPAVTEVPAGELLFGAGSFERTDLSDVLYHPLIDGELEGHQQLVLPAGGGRVAVSGTIQLSVSATAEEGREIYVRLWADGHSSVVGPLVFAADSDTGDEQTVEIEPFDLQLPNLFTHVFRWEVASTAPELQTVYTAGGSIEVVAVGFPAARAGDLLTMMVPVITESGLVVHTDAGNVIMIEEDLDSGFRT